ncbi:hypothetical protein EVAR_97148_1 [Eumeta japonica]|uniref:Uncharacterized protein n=1 Tax=Eumeta variegata TaxID=151549 RepID=A0A4C1XVE5_EUMVA|nr:hypothetical protein EVAR_97148_1 [Eumeta japonica]
MPQHWGIQDWHKNAGSRLADGRYRSVPSKWRVEFAPAAVGSLSGGRTWPARRRAFTLARSRGCICAGAADPATRKTTRADFLFCGCDERGRCILSLPNSLFLDLHSQRCS